MDKQEFIHLNEKGFKQVIEIRISEAGLNLRQLKQLRSSLTCSIGEDPRSVLKKYLLESIDSGIISAEEAHYLMRFSTFHVVYDMALGNLVQF